MKEAEESPREELHPRTKSEKCGGKVPNFVAFFWGEAEGFLRLSRSRWSCGTIHERHFFFEFETFSAWRVGSINPHI
jgi:hypothetical protein